MARQLAALFVADAVGYSRRMGEDEAMALAALDASRRIMDGAIARNGGRIVQTAGDSVIAAFPGAVAAVMAAQEIQGEIGAADLTAVFAFRIGIHFGDVVVTDTDVLGDGLNIAARLEPLAPPGAICISEVVADQIAGKVEGRFARVGRRRLKNIARPVEIWCWPDTAAGRLRRRGWTRRWPTAAGAAVLAGVIAAGVVLYSQDGRRGMPTGPRIAVLPFDEVGVAADEAFFARGLSRDINAFLSKFSNLFVLSPSATAGLAGSDCKTIRDALDTDFILNGTVRRDIDRLRVTTTFSDARSCRQLDAPGPFDRDLSAGGVLDVQIEIARKVASEIGSGDAPIFDAEIVGRIGAEAPDTLSAYECVLLSYWFYENFAPERHRRARDCLKNAVKTDPGYSLGWSRLAVSYNEAKKYAIDTPDDWAEKSRAAVQKAIDLDPDNPDAYYALAIRSQILGEERALFESYARKAIELNPNDSFVLADLGTWMAYAGEWELGKDWVTRAKQLNPKHQSWWNFIWQLHAYLQGDYSASIEHARTVDLPGNYMVQAALAAAYAMNGKAGQAEATLAHVLELKPDYADDPRQPFRARGMQPELIDGLMKGLRRAGLDIPR